MYDFVNFVENGKPWSKKKEEKEELKTDELKSEERMKNTLSQRSSRAHQSEENVMK